jgi:hypothetical protein
MSWESSSDDRLSENPRNERDAIEEAEARGYDSRSDDEQPEVNDETLSEVFQQPIKAAGDLSEVADASSGITTEDLARDLEAAAKAGVPSERELLLEILWRLRRIEEQLGIGSSGPSHRSTGGQFSEQSAAPELGTVVSPYPPAESRPPMGNPLERLKRLKRLRRSREEETDRPEESSKPED